MFVTLHLLALLATVQAACYFPNGRLSPNDTPCRDDTDHAVCCGQGYACLSNGLCQATGDELQKPGASEYVRGGCTDKTFRSSSCPAVCIDPDLDNIAGGHGLGKCEDTSMDMYYCISSGRDDVNCTSGEGVVYFPGKPSVITTIGVLDSTSVASASSAVETNRVDTATSTSTSSTHNKSTDKISSPTSPTATPIKNNSPKNEHGQDDEQSKQTSAGQPAIIGGAVGGGALVLILAGVGWWLWKKRRNAREVEPGPRYNENTYGHYSQKGGPEGAGGVQGLYEASGTGVVHQGPFEVYGSEGAWEQPRHNVHARR